MPTQQARSTGSRVLNGLIIWLVEWVLGYGDYYLPSDSFATITPIQNLAHLMLLTGCRRTERVSTQVRLSAKNQLVCDKDGVEWEDLSGNKRGTVQEDQMKSTYTSNKMKYKTFFSDISKK